MKEDVMKKEDVKKELDILVELIKNNPPERISFSSHSWEEKLSESLPNWRDVVKDPSNWPTIESVKPREDYDALFVNFLDAAGYELARRWFNSEDPERREIVCKFLRKKVGKNGLSSSIWRQLSDELKEYVIHEYFSEFPGEPFVIWERLRIDLRSFREDLLGEFVPLILPYMGYVPSPKIYQLRSDVERAGDKKYVALIDKMITERRQAIDQGFTQHTPQRIPYTPNRDERELIARLIDKARQSGFRLASLPPIFLSTEAPPLFIAYPELEDKKKLNNGRSKCLIPPSRQRGRPETISIEEVLGCYLASKEQIILYARGLRWYAREKDLNEDLLRAVVLLHEIGHWITHLLPKPGVPEWPLEPYKLTEEDVHEGWAQLMAWWVVEEVKGEIKGVFDKLNISQPAPYRVYEQFKSKPINVVMASLERLRQLKWPARIEDWERFCS